MAGTSDPKKTASEPSFIACKNCDGKGYKEEFSRVYNVVARWECAPCGGTGKLGLPDYPLIVIPAGMYKCGFCSMYGDEKGTCGLNVCSEKISRDDPACFRIFEFFVGENVDGNSIP